MTIKGLREHLIEQVDKWLFWANRCQEIDLPNSASLCLGKAREILLMLEYQ